MKDDPSQAAESPSKGFFLRADFLEHILQNNIFIGTDIARDHRMLYVVDQGELQGTYEFSLATSWQDMLDHFALRYASYKEHGYYNPAYVHETRFDFDEFDTDAALFIVRNLASGRLHCVARLAFDKDGILPMDSYCSLDQFRSEIGFKPGEMKLIEFSRLISHLTGQKELNRALVRFVFEFAVKQHVDYILGCGRCDIKHYYDKWGFKDIQPYREIDQSNVNYPYRAPMKFYPHYMKPEDIQWHRI